MTRIFFGAVLFASLGAVSAQTPTAVPSVPGLVVTTPDAAQMDRARLLLGQQDYAAALREFQDLATTYPNSSRREEALYRLAECYRCLNQADDALAAFAYFLKTYPQSLFAGPSELRLGELLTRQKKYREAIPHLEKTSASDDPLNRDYARFYLATCYLQTQRESEGRKLLEGLVEQTPPPPYQLSAVIQLADASERANETTRALELWKRVPTLTKDASLRAQAAARAGWLCLQVDNNKDAETFLNEARKNEASGDSRKLANTGLLRLCFEQKRDEDVVKLFIAEKSEFLEVMRADVLFQTGTAFTRLKRFNEAVPVLDLYLRDFSATPLAGTVAFQRLVARRELSQANVASDTTGFLRAYPTSPFANQVRLYQAEDWMRRERYPEAIPAWEGLSTLAETDASLPKETILQELGRAYFLAKRWPEAAAALRKFAERYPQSDRSLPALEQSAVALQNAQLVQQAIQAWEKVRTTAPEKSPFRQTALEQLALLLGKTQQTESAAHAFEDLLAFYPETKLRALASYSVGAFAFEQKNDAKARPFLLKAREADPASWAVPSTERLVYAAYRQKDEKALVLHLAEYDELRQKANPVLKPIPAAVIYWLASTRFQRGDWAGALPYFQRVTTGDDAGNLLNSSWWQLGLCQLRTGASLPAITSLENYRRLQPKEAKSTEFLLALADAHLGAKSYDTCRALAEQIMLQEPEGTANARARLLSAEVSCARKEYPAAAKAFAAVALLYRDPVLTPLAMKRAADAFELAGDKTSALLWREKAKATP